jgi:hypothetical protein
MKNKLEDVRNHLVAAMEALNGEDNDPAAVKQAVDRAKAMSNVANSYIESVKIEIDAIRLADEVGMLPVSVAAPVQTDRNRGTLSHGEGR